MKTTHCSLLALLVTVLAGSTVIPAALANNPPTLNAIPNMTLNEDGANQMVSLAGIGPGAPEEQQTLTVTATSSNPNVIPTPVIQYNSPNASGTLILKPATNASGTATITVTVNDGQPSDNTVSRSFLVVVTAVNDLPTISVIEDRIVDVNTSTGPIAFSVSDVESPAASLIVSASSSDSQLIPVENIVFAGTGVNRTVTVIPTLNQFGSATITITVADTAGATARREFLVTVNAQLEIKLAQPSPIVIWSATNGVLQLKGERGQWEDMLPQPTSPYSVSPSGAKFYRLRKR